MRENGGQYTHGALWVVLANLMRGDGDDAAALLVLINPITHSLTAEDARHYAVEPYVVAADVYAAPPHTGRGGWTWYTGSASWFYRVALHWMLGLRIVCREGRALPRRRPLHPQALARLHDDVSARLDDVPHPRRQPARASTAEWPTSTLDGERVDGTRCRSPTTASEQQLRVLARLDAAAA